MHKEGEDFRQLFSFKPNYFDVGGARMHYVDEGTGPAIVLCHGNPTWSFFFREVIFGLRSRFRVIVPDHLGCGLSDKPQRYAYTLQTHIENLDGLVRHLNLDRFAIGGHDWGGAIAMGWAVRNAERISKIAIFNSAAFFGPTPYRIRASGWPILGEICIRGLNLFSSMALRMAVVHRERMTEAVRRGYLFPYDGYANRVGVLRFIRDIPNRAGVPSEPVLREIEFGLGRLSRHPLIVFWGKQDFCFNDFFLAEWKRRFPNAEFHEFEDAGHYVVEDAHERIVPLLTRFLAEGEAHQGIVKAQGSGATAG